MQTGRVPVVLPAQGFPQRQNVAYPNFRRHPHLGLAATQLILGILCVVFNIGALVVNAALSPVSVGIWGGVAIIVTGSIGLAAAIKRNSCTIVTTLVMSIISALVGAALIITSSIGLAVDVNYYCYIYCYFDRTAMYVMNGFMLVFGLTEMIIAIVQSAFCCKGMGTGSVQHVTYVNNGFSGPPLMSPAGNQQLYTNTQQQLYVCVQGQMVPIGGVQLGATPGMGATAARQAPEQPQPPAYTAEKPNQMNNMGTN